MSSIGQPSGVGSFLHIRFSIHVTIAFFLVKGFLGIFLNHYDTSTCHGLIYAIIF